MDCLFLRLYRTCRSLFLQKIEKQILLNSIQEFVYQKSSIKSGKTTQNFATFFIIMPAPLTIIDHLKEKNVKLISHCSYSPDLWAHDLFSRMSRKNVCLAIFIALRSCKSLQKPRFRDASKKYFENQFERIQKTIKLKDEYFVCLMVSLKTKNIFLQNYLRF